MALGFSLIIRCHFSDPLPPFTTPHLCVRCCVGKLASLLLGIRSVVYFRLPVFLLTTHAGKDNKGREELVAGEKHKQSHTQKWQNDAASQGQGHKRVPRNWPNQWLSAKELVFLGTSSRCKIHISCLQKQAPASQSSPTAAETCIVFAVLLAAFHINSKSLAGNSH